MYSESRNKLLEDFKKVFEPSLAKDSWKKALNDLRSSIVEHKEQLDAKMNG